MQNKHLSHNEINTEIINVNPNLNNENDISKNTFNKIKNISKNIT